MSVPHMFRLHEYKYIYTRSYTYGSKGVLYDVTFATLNESLLIQTGSAYLGE